MYEIFNLNSATSKRWIIEGTLIAAFMWFQATIHPTGWVAKWVLSLREFLGTVSAIHEYALVVPFSIAALLVTGAVYECAFMLCHYIYGRCRKAFVGGSFQEVDLQPWSHGSVFRPGPILFTEEQSVSLRADSKTRFAEWAGKGYVEARLVGILFGVVGSVGVYYLVSSGSEGVVPDAVYRYTAHFFFLGLWIASHVTYLSAASGHVGHKKHGSEFPGYL